MTTIHTRRHHPYIADPAIPADQWGHQPCLCGAAKTNHRHQLPPSPLGAREHDAAILGERDGG